MAIEVVVYITICWIIIPEVCQPQDSSARHSIATVFHVATTENRANERISTNGQLNGDNGSCKCRPETALQKILEDGTVAERVRKTWPSFLDSCNTESTLVYLR